MKLDDNKDFTTLHWVKRELDDTLAQAREALEAYVDDPTDSGQMQQCVKYLHQVHGTLRMVELYGAAMVVEAMESVGTALLDNTVKDRNEAYSVLMRGLVQTPDYLERIQSGHRDIPVVLLPLLNDLRTAYGEREVSEAVLFAPNLSAELPVEAPGSKIPLPAAEQRRRVLQLREQFQVPLLAWMRKPNDHAVLALMREILDQLAGCCHSVTGRRLWWITAGVLEGLEHDQLDEQRADLRPLIGRVDRAIKQLIDGGEMALSRGDAEDLTRQLLYYVSRADGSSERLLALRQTYDLADVTPDDVEVEHARGAMSGHNRALLDTVAGAIKEDLLRVKDALDLFLRKPHKTPEDLAPQVEVLDRVSDTLGMLGLAVPSRVIEEQHHLVQSIVDGSHAHDEGTLLDVAGALLYVESSLDDHIERLGAEAGALGAQDEAPVSAEARKVLDALMAEAAVNLTKVKHDITAFIETPWDHREVEKIPGLLREIGGAMRMLDVQRPANLLSGISGFVQNELIVERRVPTVEQMEKLADALASIEYYFEASREHRAGRDRILDVTEQSLAAIGYWPVPPLRERQPDREDLAAVHDMAGDEYELTETVSIADGRGIEDLIVGQTPDTARPDENLDGLRFAETESAHTGGADAEQDWIEIEEQVEEQVADEDASLVDGFESVSDEIDEDIREVFIEEFEEEITALHASMAAWKGDTNNLDALKTIRRSFHTLKGSGRLVGALGVGEFSWKVENMLNRVLDQTIKPSDDVTALVEHSLAALPSLLARLKGEAAAPAPINAIMLTADKLSEGQSARLEDIKPVGTRTVTRTVKRRVPRPQPVEVVPTAKFVESLPQAEEPVEEREQRSDLVIGAPVLPPIDPVLLDILRSEVAQHIGVMRGFHDEHADAQTSVQVSESLLRAVHTLSGAVAMVDIPVLVHVLAPLESYLKRLRARESGLPREGFGVLGECSDVVDAVMMQFDTDTPVLPECDTLVEQVCRLRDALPEPAMAHTLFGIDLEPATDTRADAEDLAPTQTDRHQSLDEELLGIDSSAMQGVDIGEHVHDLPFASDEDEAKTWAEDRESVDTSWLTSEIESAAAGLPDKAIAPDGFAATVAGQLPVGPVEELSDRAPEHEEPREAEAQEAIVGEDAPVEDGEQPEPEVESVDEPQWATAQDTEEDVEEDIDEDEAVVEPEPEPEPVVADAQQPPVEEIVMAARRSSIVAEDPQPDEPLNLPDLDADLLEIFVQEANEILDQAESSMVALREHPDDAAVVAGLQRDLHTLKGGARMAGLAPIGDLGHTMESVLEAIAEGKRHSDAQVVDGLEHGFDVLHELVQRVANNRAVAMPEHAIAHFNALLKGTAEEVPEAADEDFESVTDTAEDAPASIEDDAPVSLVSRPAFRPLPGMAVEPAAAMHAPQEMIRVRSDLLDSLVNYAGEVSIYRSRLEEQVSTFRFNLVEFDQTTSRLRDQLRKMEIETEAQIIARYQREQEEAGQSNFDPLELDRFSQLQQYSRALAESVSDLVSIQTMLDDITRQSETLLLQQSRVSSDLQEGLMRTRMVPFDSLVPSLRRTLRQAAQETGKRAQLRITGAQGEMDRNLLERIKAPFEHMLRNAMAHGIERPEDRRRTGKPEEGVVRIAVSRDATEVVIEVSDDGAGINLEAVRRKAIERGLMKSDAQLSDRDISAFMLETGFSTASEVTKLAGRGVGMDVVASEIKQLGGTLAIDSQVGKGTSFTIRLPFTLAVTQAILIRIGENVFAVPMTSVQGVARIAREDLRQRLSEPNAEYIYAGESYQMYDLASLLNLPAQHLSDEAQVPMLMTRTGDQRAAVRIDNVVGSREIVVKSVGPQVSSVPGIFGATIMGDGSVVMILDLAPLVRRHVALRADGERDATGIQAPTMVEAEPKKRERPLVMVVDDSITMRKVTTRILERNEMESITAKDGLDAVEKLQENIPDLMLLDIEMPRMDGYELATYMRNDPRLRHVPIIMVTSRTGEKHRQRALEVGVQRYLGKPYQEADLLKNVQEALQASRV